MSITTSGRYVRRVRMGTRQPVCDHVFFFFDRRGEGGIRFKQQHTRSPKTRFPTNLARESKEGTPISSLIEEQRVVHVRALDRLEVDVPGNPCVHESFDKVAVGLRVVFRGGDGAEGRGGGRGAGERWG